nr:prostaglandin reductase 1-like isoform X2 [Halyomorpha halys]
MKAKKFILKKPFEGLPKKTDFELIEEELPPLKDGDVLFEAIFLSVDPYMRQERIRPPLGTTMIGEQVARVLESKHPDYKVGDNVVAELGWRSRTVVNPDTIFSAYGYKAKPHVLPNFGNISLSAAIGALGMPGNTAWFGLTKLCDPKAGETLVVTGAAGAVGSLVGQIGKNLGLTVIGFAGSDEKVKMLKEELNFDHAFNYKTCNVAESLKIAAPKGVDIYFDNVGGKISDTIMNAMNLFGRVAVCGSISSYNNDPNNLPVAPILQPTILFKQLRVEGFFFNRWLDIWMEGVHKNLEFMKQGKLKAKETVIKGFDNMVDGFIGMLVGENTGKAVIEA